MIEAIGWIALVVCLSVPVFLLGIYAGIKMLLYYMEQGDYHKGLARVASEYLATIERNAQRTSAEERKVA